MSENKRNLHGQTANHTAYLYLGESSEAPPRVNLIEFIAPTWLCFDYVMGSRLRVLCANDWDAAGTCSKAHTRQAAVLHAMATQTERSPLATARG